ncbi:MAG: group 1 truncated hemoglobin [Proteobacteria bacterium]|nr:group 1 truncated hemoglobin [Pseudomonadota bacterium]
MTPSLYDRLGASAGIANLVDKLVELHLANPVVKQRFLPYLESPERVAEIKRHSCAFLAMGTGGPAEYAGRSMPDTHRGMNISDAEYMAVIDDILAAARACGLGDDVQKDLLSIAWSLKGDIVRQ